MGGGLERRRGCWWETRRRTSMLQNASRGIGGEPGEDRRHAASAVSASFWRCWRNCSYQPSLRWYASHTHVFTTGRPPTSRSLLAQSCAVSKTALITVQLPIFACRTCRTAAPTVHSSFISILWLLHGGHHPVGVSMGEQIRRLTISVTSSSTPWAGLLLGNQQVACFVLF